MLGTLVNAFAIMFGGTIGTLFSKKLSERYSEIILQAIALSVLLLGLLNAFETKNVLLLIVAMALGSLIGEWINIEDKLNKLGHRIQDAFGHSNGKIAEGFVMATLVYCVGSMAILGAIESGISNDHTTLFAKSILDGVSSLVFASTLGIGVAFSAISVVLYQGTITLLAGQMSDVLTPVMIRELSAVGGLLIMTIGLNILKVTKIRVGNMLPAVFIPVIYYLLLPGVKDLFNI